MIRLLLLRYYFMFSSVEIELCTNETSLFRHFRGGIVSNLPLLQHPKLCPSGDRCTYNYSFDLKLRTCEKENVIHYTYNKIYRYFLVYTYIQLTYT